MTGSNPASRDALRTPVALSVLLAAMMGVQAALGLALRGEYRDAEWIRAAWYGNDWVTLVVALPLLAAALVLARRGSLRGLLLWLGMLGYSTYNYLYYLFGAALNAFLPLYTALVVLAVSALILALSRIDPAVVAAGFHPRTPARVIGGCLTAIGTGLACVQFAVWAAYVFAGRPTPIEPEAFKLVAALDTTVMVPALVAGGVLLWRRRPWGFMISAIAGLQGALYLLVLSVNSVIGFSLGLAQPPGELPLWAVLGVVTGAATILLVVMARAGTAASAAADRPVDRSATSAR